MRFLILPIFSSTHLVTKRLLTFYFSLLTSNSQAFGLFVRYILYPIDGFFSSEFRTNLRDYILYCAKPIRLRSGQAASRVARYSPWCIGQPARAASISSISFLLNPVGQCPAFEFACNIAVTDVNLVVKMNDSIGRSNINAAHSSLG